MVDLAKDCLQIADSIKASDEGCLRVAGRVGESVVDGPGLRYTLFLQGCPHRCFGCHNPETHAMDGGVLVSCAQVLDEIDANPLLGGVSLSGGEPFCQSAALLPLVKAIRARGLDVLVFTGYHFEDLLLHTTHRALLEEIDILVDGPFILQQRNLLLRFRGSDNQRILDVPASLQAKKAVLHALQRS